MESSRRPSLDRSREPGLKKPRIVEEPNRPFSRPVNSGSSRFRASERDRDSDGAGGYVPQPPQQPYQELVNQYKSALSELTFNSKPIITNLTIIAGENLHAAKPIASVVCANILEVPSEQKLPSLYLLDSIVKNIGRDFIKYFAARLPEVFCKAYRHVDPSIHPGMRHLFGTWKGVFPPQPLQIIEKELGFQSAANGSSRSSATRPDSQAQRQPHSIHVNPKYLERQHLQQSSKSKGAASDIGGTVNSTEDLERPERAASFGAQRTGPDAGVKMQRPQRAPLGVSSREKDIGTGYGDYEYGSGLSRPSGSGFGRPSGRMAESKQWLDAGRGNEDPVTSQRNGYDVKHGISNYGVTRTGNGRISALQNVVSKSSGDMSNSWKNSEEEEYTWDELTSKGTDRAALHGSRKDPWTPDGLENLEFEKSETSLDSVSGEQKEQVPFGNRRTSPWQWQEPQSIDGSLVSKTGFHSHTGPSPVGTVSVSGPTGYAGHSVLPRGGKHPVNQYTPSPSLSSRDPRLNFVEKEHNQAPPSRNPVPGLSDMGTRNNKFPDSLPSSKQNLQLDSLKEMQPHDLQRFSDLAPSLQSRLRGPLPQQLSTSPLEAEPSDQSQRSPHDLQGFHKTRVTLSSDQLNPLAGDVPVQSKTSSLLAALTKSGVLSKTPDNLSSGNVATAISEPGSRPPAKSVLSDPRHVSSGGLHEDSQKLQRPPLPTAVQPLSSSPEGSTSAQTSNAGTTGSIGFTSLLSTLVSKGLISASNSESVAPASAEALKQLQKQSPTAATNAARVNSALVSSNSNTSTDDKRHSAEFADISSETSPQIKKEEIESLIGFEFRPRVLRELHETVIDGLFDSLPHRCSICGLRFKLQERLARHLKWHESKDSESNNSNAASRRWYSNSADWVVGKEELPFGFTSASPSQKREEAVQENAEMVPADEDRCVCFLCGQLFEDFYSLDRDEWMFKGAVFMTVPSEGSEGSSGNCESSVFVHAKCRSDTSAQDLGLVNGVKVEQGT